jgi:GMP synthase-like glutamine amidotransferase
VVSSPQPEVGFFPIRLNDQGRRDPLLRGLPDEFEVFHWHEDMWELPTEGALLAGSQRCPRQLFRLGPSAYGMQFHVEITRDCIVSWCDAYIADPDRREKTKSKILGEYDLHKTDFERTAEIIYTNFHRLIQQTLPVIP